MAKRAYKWLDNAKSKITDFNRQYRTLSGLSKQPLAAWSGQAGSMDEVFELTSACTCIESPTWLIVIADLPIKGPVERDINHILYSEINSLRISLGGRPRAEEKTKKKPPMEIPSYISLFISLYFVIASCMNFLSIIDVIYASMFYSWVWFTLCDVAILFYIFQSLYYCCLL